MASSPEPLASLSTLLTLMAAVAEPAAVVDAPMAERARDPQVDQAWISPTALTQPAGT